MSDSPPVRFALLGLGEAARKIHLPAIAKLRDVRLVGAVDPDPEARRWFASSHREVPVEADPAPFLDRTKPDWVLIAAPPATHVDLALRSLAAGCNVLCEKPLASDLESVDRLIGEAKSRKRLLGVNHEFPRMPIFAALLAKIGAPDFGRPLFFQAWENIFYPPQQEHGWRAAGSTMREFGTHVVDLAMNVFGGPPTSVFARMPDPTGAGIGDPIDLVTMDFPHGRSASIVISRLSRGPRRYLDVRLDGEESTLRASIGGRAGVSAFLPPGRRLPRVRLEVAPGGQAWRESGDRRKVLARNPLDAFADATARHLRAVLDAAREGQPIPASAEWARHVVAVVEATYRSARSGLPVAL